MGSEGGTVFTQKKKQKEEKLSIFFKLVGWGYKGVAVRLFLVVVSSLFCFPLTAMESRDQTIFKPGSLAFSFDSDSQPRVDSHFSEIMVNLYNGVSESKLKKCGFPRWKIRLMKQSAPTLNEILENVLNNPKATNQDFGNSDYAREIVRAGRVLESRIMRAAFLLMKNPQLNNKQLNKKGLSKKVVHKAKSLIGQVEKIPQEKTWDEKELKKMGYSGRAIDWAWDIALLRQSFKTKGLGYVPPPNLYLQALVEYARKQCLDSENEELQGEGPCEKIYRKLNNITDKIFYGMARI